jgi:hypothetical protein
MSQRSHLNTSLTVMYFFHLLCYNVHRSLMIINWKTKEYQKVFNNLTSSRAHQTRWSGRSSHPISAEITLPRLQSEIKVALFLFASRSLLANNLHFMVKVIDKAIVINVIIYKNERKWLYSINKENLSCWDKNIMGHGKFLNLFW